MIKKKKIERAKRASINQERSENNGPPTDSPPGTDTLQSSCHVVRRCCTPTSKNDNINNDRATVSGKKRLPSNLRWLETKTHPSHTPPLVSHSQRPLLACTLFASSQFLCNLAGWKNSSLDRGDGGGKTKKKEKKRKRGERDGGKGSQQNCSEENPLGLQPNIPHHSPAHQNPAQSVLKRPSAMINSQRDSEKG